MADYVARSSVILNGQQADDQLEKLTKKATSLRKEMKKLREANDKTGYDKVARKLKEVNKETRQLKKETFSVEKVLKNISGASFGEVATAARKATAEFKKMKQTDPGYAKKAAQVKTLNIKVRELSALTRTQNGMWGRMAGGFNKYFTMATAAIASLTGLAFTVKSAVNNFAEFDDKLSDVMKTTGLTKDRVKVLNAELEKIDTRTSQEELLNLARVAGKLGITAEKDILGFVRAADQISVALGEDLGGAEDAVRELGKLTDIFKIKELFGQEQALLKIGSAINELGMASTANEAYLVEFAKRTAGIAPQAGVSVQNIMGLAATLDALGQKSESSSTAYSKLMTTMTKKTSEFANIAGMEITEFSQLLSKDANEAMIRVFEGISKKDGGFQQMVAVLGDLGVEGQRMTSVFGALANNTELLREQQLLSNKAFDEGISLTNEFGIKNENAQAKLEKARKSFAEMQRELGERLAPAYASIIHKGSTMIKLLGATVEFLFKNRKALIMAAVAIGSYTVAVNAANWATKLYTALTTAATAITKAFNIAVKSNPVGLIIALLTTAATAFYLFGQKADDAKKSQKEFNDEIERGNELMGQSKTLEERTSVIKNLSKQQLENLKSDLQSQLSAEDDYHATLLQKAKKRIDEDAELQHINELRKQKDLTTIQKINLAAQANARASFITRELNDENKTNKTRLKNLKKHLANVSAELRLRPDEEGGGYNGDSKEAAKKLLAALEKQSNEKKAILTRQRADEEITEEQFNNRMLLLELAFLESKKVIIQNGGEATSAIDLEIANTKLRITQARIKKEEELEKEAEHATKEKKEEADKKEKDRLAQLKEDYEAVKKLFANDNEITPDGKIASIDAIQEIIQENLNEELNAVEQTEYFKTLTVQQQEAEREKIRQKHADNFVNSVQEQAEIWLDVGGKVGEMFGDMVANQEVTMKEFAKNMIIFALDILEQQLTISIAAATIQSLASAESIATFGVAGIVKAAVLTGLMKAAFGAAKGLVGKFAEGKYPDMEYAGRPQTGTYGSRPQLGIFNEVPGQPETVIDGITTREININHPEIMEAIYAVRDGRQPAAFAEGKYPEKPVEEISAHKNSPELLAIIQQNTQAMKALKDMKIYTSVEDIRNADERFTEMEITRGL